MSLPVTRPVQCLPRLRICLVALLFVRICSVSGSQLSWKADHTLSKVAFMTAVTVAMGTWSTMACSVSFLRVPQFVMELNLTSHDEIGDFSRYSKTESSALLQMATIPFLFSICAFFGAISSNCSLAIYGELLCSSIYFLLFSPKLC